MEKNFDKQQFKKSQTKLATMCAILAVIGFISFLLGCLLGNGLNGLETNYEEYYHNPNDYYGIYTGVDNDNNVWEVEINEQGGKITISEQSVEFFYEYYTAQRVKEEYSDEKNSPAIFIYDSNTEELLTIFWIKDVVDGQYVFKVGNSSLQLEIKDQSSTPNTPETSPITQDGFKLSLLDNQTYRIWDYVGDETELIIPEKYNDIIITEIATNAFLDAYITSAYIPETVTKIEYGAFGGCIYLKQITIPFVGETKDGQTNTRFSHIFGRYSLGSMFSNLKTVVITGGTKIDDSSFSGCEYITSITLPETLTYIGLDAFYGCSSLAYNVKENLKYLGTSNNDYFCLIGTTYNYTQTSPIIDSNCKIIYDWAFERYNNITEVVIPDSVISIGSAAFCNCSSLKKVTIGKNVTSIFNSAFSGCTKLIDVYYNGSEEEWNQIFIDIVNDELLFATIHYNN